MDYRITYAYDEDASVWIATSDDIPGLVPEDESLDRLEERVKIVVSELIELNR